MSFFRTDAREYEGLLEATLLPDISRHFALFINSLADKPSNELYLGAALVSFVTEQGHICLDLSHAEGRPFYDPHGRYICHCPPLKTWQKQLLQSGVVGRPGDFVPLVLDSRCRLYLHRYWKYENCLATHLRERAQKKLIIPEGKDLGGLLRRYFPLLMGEEMDWQGLAAFTSATKKLCVISGGPGTGKTTTVCKIISFALELCEKKDVKIALAAPTGKAAARLEEAMKFHRNSLPASEEIKARIPVEASTIHRLLGYRQGSPYFIHNKENPLSVDMVVVDEASMVDLPLMAKLFDAIPEDVPIILLGDKDQLASVEAGAVMGDICSDEMVRGFSKTYAETFERTVGKSPITLQAQQCPEGLQDCVVELTKNYRFGPESGIGHLARAIKEGDVDAVMNILQDSHYHDVQWHLLPHSRLLTSALRAPVLEGYGPVCKAKDMPRRFEVFDRFRILCAIRQGPYGVVGLNRLVERILGGSGLVSPGVDLYPGLPLLITRNDYSLGIYNGDVGIVAPAEEDRGVVVCFRNLDGSFKEIHPSRLPDFEIAYAMSIHKSQGSEFDEVMIILPDTDVPILTRELIYTAVTRARKKVSLWAKPDILQIAISRRIRRHSGLREALA